MQRGMPSLAASALLMALAAVAMEKQAELLPAERWNASWSLRPRRQAMPWKMMTCKSFWFCWIAELLCLVIA